MTPGSAVRCGRTPAAVRSRIRAIFQVAAVAGVLLLGAALGCSRKQPPPPQEAATPLDHVDSAKAKPSNFLHKTFSVKKYAHFSFAVPPHAATPHLHGTFRSFIQNAGDEPLSDDTADVEFLLLNAEQYDDFTHGHNEGTALYSTEPTHAHEVDFALSPSHETPDTYYIVFRNSRGAAVKSVEADFTLSFGY